MNHTQKPDTKIELNNSCPKVTIVILNWNGKDDTLECLDSVRRIIYSNCSIVVVDNGSIDGSVEAIKATHPNVTVLETGANLGFAEGNNVGIRWAIREGAEYIYLLNNDTVVDPGVIDEFIKVTKAFPDAGILGGNIYYYSDPTRRWYAGVMWDEKRMHFIHRGDGINEKQTGFKTIQDTAYACGCSLFISTAVISDVGLMDSRFFLTYEETDWCYRARRAGYAILFAPDAIVWHKVSASFGGSESPLINYFMARNRLLWGEKNLPIKGQLRLFKTVLRELIPPYRIHSHEVGNVIKWAWWATVGWRASLQKRWEKLVYRAECYGVRDYFLRRFGNCPDGVRALLKNSPPAAEEVEAQASVKNN